MRARSALLAAAVLAGITASPSLAATKPPKKLPTAVPLSLTDIAGDANGFNGQGFDQDTGQHPEQAGGGRSAADILNVTFSRLDDTKTVQGFKVAMKLGAAPDQGAAYEVDFELPGCSLVYLRSVQWLGSTSFGSTKLTENCTGSSVKHDVPVTVAGDTITWTVPNSVLPAVLKPGAVLTNIYPCTLGGVGTDATTGGLVVPTLDEKIARDQKYTIGQ